MIFRAPMLEKVLDGSKTVTRRPAPIWPNRQYATGRMYAIQPGRGQHAIAHLLVVDKHRERLDALNHLPLEETYREGFPTAAAFYEYWRGLYGEVDLRQAVMRIAFELTPTTVTIRTLAEIEHLRKPYRARSWTLVCERVGNRLGITPDQAWDALGLSSSRGIPPRPDPR